MGAYTNKYSTGVSEDVSSVTPSNATGILTAEGDRVPLIRALYVTTGGTLKYTKPDGSDRTIPVPSFFLVEGAMTRVYAAGTTATGLLAYV